MAYADDVAADKHSVGYYVAFAGIATRISTHNPSEFPNWSPSGTFIEAIAEDSISGGEEQLDRGFGVLTQGEVTFNVLNKPAVQALLTRRGGVNDFITVAMSATAGLLTVESGANPFGTPPQTVYLDRETLSLTGYLGSGQFTCTRGQSGSTAEPHQARARISSVPIHWYTREATLYVVNLQTGTEKAIITGTITNDLTCDNDVWPFTIAGKLNDLLKRPLCNGWKEVDALSATATLFRNVVFEVADAREFQSPGFIRITSNGKTGIYGNGGTSVITISTATNPHTILVDLGASRAGHRFDAEELDGASVSLRQVDVLIGRPGHVALQAILSDYGNGDNSSVYDVLAGRPADSGSGSHATAKRMGAGIPAASVDVDSFQECLANEHTVIWLDETRSLGNLLEQDLLWRMGGYVYCTGDGVLTFKAYSPASIRGALTEYDTDDQFESNVVSTDSESGVIGRAELVCNYDPIRQDFLRKVELVFQDDMPVYGRRAPYIAYEARGVWVGDQPREMIISAPTNEVALEVHFDRQRARQVVGGRRTTRAFPWRHHLDVVPGARLALTDPRMVDHEGGRGVTARPYEVTGRTLDWGTGDVIAELDEVPAGWLLAPAAAVSAWTASGNLLDLAATGVFAQLFDDLKPARDFPSGCVVRIYDATDNFASSDTAVATVASDARLALATTPSLNGGDPPAAGDIVVLENSADTGNVNDVGADVLDFAFGSDTDGLVGTGEAYEREGPKWS